MKNCTNTVMNEIELKPWQFSSVLISLWFSIFILYSYLLALPTGVNKYEIIVSFSVVNIQRTEKYSTAFCWSFSLDWKLEAVRLICKLVPLKWVSSNPRPISYFCNKMGFTVFPDYWWRWILQVFINLDAKEGSI